jgi:hypothetical protein
MNSPDVTAVQIGSDARLDQVTQREMEYWNPQRRNADSARVSAL